MDDLKDLDITEFTRSKEEGYFISSNAPSSGLFIKLERYKELEQRVKELEIAIGNSLVWLDEGDKKSANTAFLILKEAANTPGFLTTNKDSK